MDEDGSLGRRMRRDDTMTPSNDALFRRGCHSYPFENTMLRTTNDVMTPYFRVAGNFIPRPHFSAKNIPRDGVTPSCDTLFRGGRHRYLIEYKVLRIVSDAVTPFFRVADKSQIRPDLN